MKKYFLPVLVLFVLSAFRFQPAATNPIDKADFTEKFKLVFEAAKKRFATEIGAQESSFSSDKYTKKYAGSIAFKNATTGIVLDAEDLKYYQIQYTFSAATLDDAKAVKKEVADLIKTLVPSDFKTYSTYMPGYAGYMTEVFEFNSDIFAEISKKPVVRVGIILIEEGKYTLEILVNEPVFKTAKDK